MLEIELSVSRFILQYEDMRCVSPTLRPNRRMLTIWAIRQTNFGRLAGAVWLNGQQRNLEFECRWILVLNCLIWK